MKNNDFVKKLVLSAIFLATGIILPFFTGQIPPIGRMLLPMHIPVFLCSLICGWQYGLAVGFMLPLMRSMLFFMPAIFPDAAAMAFELAAYGFFCGFLYEKSPWHCIKSLYRCLLSSMLFGRIVWGVAMLIFLGTGSEGFTAGAFFAGAFFNAIPGIILQLAIIPSIMLALDKTHMVPFRKKLRIKKNCKNRVLRHNLSLFTKNLLKIFQIGYINPVLLAKMPCRILCFVVK